jgi:DNA-binding PadR family transcriptional regulator
MRRNMRFFWPRAESRVYDELRRLHDEGLVEARHEHTGRRRRTIWAITDRGGERVQSWLATPPRSAYMESEPLLRLLLGNLGDEAQLRTAIARIRADASDLAEVAHGVAGAYAAGRAPFQPHVANRALVFTCLAGYASVMLAWADEAEDYLAGLADAAPDARADAALALIERARERLPPTA